MADLNDVLKVRVQRVRRARAEADRRREALLRAQSAVAEARDRQLAFERQAESAGVVEGAASGRPIKAADIQQRLAFVAGLRTKARDLAPAIRRAELVRGRAQEAADEASLELNREVRRQEAVAQVVSQRQAERRRLEESRSEQGALDERSMYVVALRAAAGEVRS